MPLPTHVKTEVDVPAPAGYDGSTRFDPDIAALMHAHNLQIQHMCEQQRATTEALQHAAANASS